jgi:molybdopterin-guanine dinucleotide biosynthesis protein A
MPLQDPSQDPSQDITGLILSGGQGLRMGGVDKGLQPWQGEPLVQHALRRLRGQVGPVLISANRNLPAYAALGAPVWSDLEPGYPGPLAGLLAGLAHAHTSYVAAVPCDAPLLPLDLVARLAAALQANDAEIAMAATLEAGIWRPQPVFCLLRRELHGSLAQALRNGQRKAGQWMAGHRCVHVRFDDAQAFFNANTLADLQRLPPPGG